MKKINILNDGEKSFIELKATLPQENLDLTVVEAARVSYMKETKEDEDISKFIESLLKRDHTSPFEQVEFQFIIQAPVIVWWQLVRHRTFNFNLRSGRYTEFSSEEDFYIPHFFPEVSGKNVLYDDPKSDNIKLRKIFTERLKSALIMYNTALESGVRKEHARYFLPAWSMYYVGYAKVDCKNLMNFLKQRTDKHAQWEIRQYANAIYDLVSEKMPITMDAFHRLTL